MIALDVVSHTAEVMTTSEGGGKYVGNENGERALGLIDRPPYCARNEPRARRWEAQGYFSSSGDKTRKMKPRLCLLHFQIKKK